MRKKSIRDVDFEGQTALVRLDFNVPLSGEAGQGKIAVADDTRIRAALPTLNYLLDEGATLVLASHLGRPKSAAERQLALDPVAARLSALLGRPLTKLDQVVGPEVSAAVAAARPGDVLLLENTRFHPGEKANDPELARQLAALADVYVNDAFGSAHRAHASTEGVARAMRAAGKPAVAGFLMEKELAALSVAVEEPPHPFVAILGGAKISDKIRLIEHLLEAADKLLIGGAMANTFFRAKGYETGRSLVEEAAVAEASRLLERYPGRLALPVDVVVAADPQGGAGVKTVAADAIPPGRMALDIGPQTLERFKHELAQARLVIWNGPLGYFENPAFAAGTNALAHFLAARVDAGAQVIIGGGDSAAAVAEAGLADQMSHVSTGGGASLEFLEGQTLPGVAALDDNA
ncbi:MAG: phosphoglycerate kinase [Candidatus Promineifilaceae bacterium]